MFAKIRFTQPAREMIRCKRAKAKHSIRSTSQNEVAKCRLYSLELSLVFAVAKAANARAHLSCELLFIV